MGLSSLLKTTPVDTKFTSKLLSRWSPGKSVIQFLARLLLDSTNSLLPPPFSSFLRPLPKFILPGAQNQAPHCWQRFNQYVLCVKKTGSEDECASMRQLAISVCPDDWTEKWDEEREAGNFAGIQEHEKAVEKH